MSEKLLRECTELLDTIDPISSSTAQTTAWVDVSNFREVTWELLVGLIAATGTIDMTVQQATSAAGAGAKNITELDGVGTFAITQLTDADDNKAVHVTLLTEFLDVSGGFNFIQVTVTCATAASLISLSLRGFRERHEPRPTTLYDEVVGP